MRGLTLKPGAWSTQTCFLAICLVGWAGCGRGDNAPEEPDQALTEQVERRSEPLTFALDALDPAVGRAIRNARQAVQAGPKSAEAWGRLGKVLLAHDMFQTAANCFVEAARLNPHEPRWPYFQAIALRTIDPVRAVDELRCAVELFGPEAVEPQIRLAERLLELERVDEAEKIVNELLTSKPDTASAYVTRAKIQLLRNEPRRALESLDRTGQQRTQQGLLLAAEAHRRLGQLDEAERTSELARLAPKVGFVDPYFDEVSELRTGLKASLTVADQLFVQNRVRESIQLLQQVVRDYPESEWAQILLARGLIRMRRVPEAQKALKQALALNPKSFEGHFRMAVSYQVSGQYEQAAEWFEKTIELQPASAVAYMNLGLCRFRLKEMERAEAALTKSVSVQPNYFDGHMALGEFFAQRSRFAESRKALQSAQRLRPEDQRVSALLRHVDELESQP